MMRTILVRGTIAAGLVLALFSAPARAQADVYSQEELDTPARLASQEVTARILARSYPPNLKRAGVTGTVQLQFIVDHEGKVETSSVRVVQASSPELADAAKSVVDEIRFRAGRRGGAAVRSVVTLPIAYQ